MKRNDPPQKTTLGLQLQAFGCFVPEHQFHPLRHYAFDWASPGHKVAVEYEGGIWRGGGGAHSHPTNIERDIDKHNAAQLLGWIVIRVTEKQVDTGEAFEMVCHALQARTWVHDKMPQPKRSLTALFAEQKARSQQAYQRRKVKTFHAQPGKCMPARAIVHPSQLDVVITDGNGDPF